MAKKKATAAKTKKSTKKQKLVPVLNVTIKKMWMAPFNQAPDSHIYVAITNSKSLEAVYNGLAHDEVIGFVPKSLNRLLLVRKSTPGLYGFPEYDTHEIMIHGEITPAELARIQVDKNLNILNPQEFNDFYARHMRVKGIYGVPRRR